MRRSTPGCTPVAQEQQRLLRLLQQLDPLEVARALEPFVRPERAARLRGVFAARLDAVTVVLDSPHDPHNGAAVLRSCDAFGLQRLHVVERLERFLASNTVARGSERWVEMRTWSTPAEVIGALGASGHELVAAHAGGELMPGDLREVPRLALVLGNERHGIHPEILGACARSVSVPMRGFAESLNLSVTAAILLQHATGDRRGDLPEEEQQRLYARALVLTVPHAPEILEARGVKIPELGVVQPL